MLNKKGTFASSTVSHPYQLNIILHVFSDQCKRKSTYLRRHILGSKSSPTTRDNKIHKVLPVSPLGDRSLDLQDIVRDDGRLDLSPSAIRIEDFLEGWYAFVCRRVFASSF